MRAIVTGCAGFIGSHLAERLLSMEHDVIGIDCLTDYYDRDQKFANLSRLRDHWRFTFVQEDLLDVDLTTLVDGVDVIYHQAAQPGVRASWGTYFDVYARNNILVTQRLLEAVKDIGLRKFVYASSSSIYGDAETFPTSESVTPQPVSPYGVSKLSAEQLVYLYSRNYGLPTTSLRYFTVYGPRQRPDMAFHRFIHWALDGTPVQIYGDGNQTRDFTFVSDIVSANIAASESPISGSVYNIGGGSQISVNSVLAMLTEMLGHPIEVQHLRAERGDVRHTSADTSLARAELGFQPSVSLYCGLAQEVEWVIQRHQHRARGLAAAQL